MTATSIIAPSPVPVDTRSSVHPGNDNAPTTLKPTLPKPKLRLHLQDARHPAAASFLSILPDLEAVLDAAIAAITDQLYTPPGHRLQDTTLSKATALSLPSFNPSIPPTRSVTVILHDFPGVAYTNGTDLDDDHKEIHFSLSYINHVIKDDTNALAELKGVLTHELVHCYQHTAPPNALRPPGGLIEGIADFVRLKAGLGALHWTRPKSAADRASKWDEGYQHTAYFLSWLEDERIGRGAIGLLNDRLLRKGYTGGEEGKEKSDGENQPDSFWKCLYGVEVADLWEEYGEYLDRGN